MSARNAVGGLAALAFGWLGAGAAAAGAVENTFCPVNFNSTPPGSSQTCGFARVFGTGLDGTDFNGSPVPPSPQGFVTGGAGGTVSVAGGGSGGVNGVAQGQAGFGALHAFASTDSGGLPLPSYAHATAESFLGFGDWAIAPGTPDQVFNLHARVFLEGGFSPSSANGTGFSLLQDNGLLLIAQDLFVSSLNPTTQVDYDFLIHGGDQLGFYMTMRAQANVSGALLGSVADMRNTGAFFLDLTGTDLKLQTASGHDYSLSAGATANAPEPAAWAMMLLGFGGVGAALRARRRPLAA
jgi:hypothetical protein